MRIQTHSKVLLLPLINLMGHHYCGAKEFGNPDPFHIKYKAHVEEEEMSEDEQRMSKLPGRCRGQSCPWQTEITEGKSSTPPKAASQSVPKERTSVMS